MGRGSTDLCRDIMWFAWADFNFIGTNLAG